MQIMFKCLHFKKKTQRYYSVSMTVQLSRQLSIIKHLVREKLLIKKDLRCDIAETFLNSQLDVLGFKTKNDRKRCDLCYCC